MKQMEVSEVEGDYVVGRIKSVRRQLTKDDFLEIKNSLREAEGWNDAELFSERCRNINQQYRLSRYRRYLSYFFLLCAVVYLIFHFLFL